MEEKKTLVAALHHMNCLMKYVENGFNNLQQIRVSVYEAYQNIKLVSKTEQI